MANRQIKNAQARRARKIKGAEIMNFGPEGKIWRQPTLAEPIEPLPSARLCLTAVFGMGTGRTTALWPPKRCCSRTGQTSQTSRTTNKRTKYSLKTTHRDSLDNLRSRVKSQF